jgi:hypothetical protein
VSHYEDPALSDPQQLADAIASNDADSISERLIALSLQGEEPSWLTSQAINLSRHPDLTVRRASVVALGHLARVTRTVDDRVIAHLTSLADDPELAGPATDALDDIAMFVQP